MRPPNSARLRELTKQPLRYDMPADPYELFEYPEGFEALAEARVNLNLPLGGVEQQWREQTASGLFPYNP